MRVKNQNAAITPLPSEAFKQKQAELAALKRKERHECAFPCRICERVEQLTQQLQDEFASAFGLRHLRYCDYTWKQTRDCPSLLNSILFQSWTDGHRVVVSQPDRVEDEVAELATWCARSKASYRVAPEWAFLRPGQLTLFLVHLPKIVLKVPPKRTAGKKKQRLGDSTRENADC